jgi:hypothetical protein
MSTKAESVLAEFNALPPEDQREVSDFIIRQLTGCLTRSAPRRTIADIAGKYHACPDAEAKRHDRSFAEAVA